MKARRRPRLALAAGFGCRCGRSECRTHEPVVPEDRVELPAGIEPVSYALDLKLRMEDHEFDGVVRIAIHVGEHGLSSCSLHAKELTFSSAELEGVGVATEIVFDDLLATATLTFGQVLPVGPQVLKIAYVGTLNDQMDGFYRSSYTNAAGEKQLMASTFFCATTARKCFPCWDEPRRKATFTCSLRVPSHLLALSNMPEAGDRVDHDDGTTTRTFAESPRMSTYLLCFVVGEFDSITATSKNGALIRVFAPLGKAELGRWALEHATLALDRFDEVFDIPYPLPKVDLVAIPEFAMGAMENWGLITYRETALLLAKDGSPAQRQRVAETVIHEVAHQWFGNLVTMEWWEDIWLNEGFATWMETYVCAEAHPSWHKWAQFVSEFQAQALAKDSLRSSHPIQMPMQKAEQVDEVFDAISYQKGSSVIRMIFAVVGEAAFFAGLRQYMSVFRYGNATTNDLWSHLESASGKPVRRLMGDWTLQMGFPLLEVTAVEATDCGKVLVHLKQGWFLADGSDVAESERKVWSIPVFSVGSGEGHAPGDGLHLMPATERDELRMEGDGVWIKLNAGQHVPMRVKYPDSMVPALAAAMRAGELAPVDRVGLISDHAALSRARMLDPAMYLEILSSCASDGDPTVLAQALGRMSGLASLLSNVPSLSAPFRSFVRSVLLPQVRSLGWDPRPSDGHLTRKLRGRVLDMLPQFCGDDEDVLAEARRRFKAFVADTSKTDALPGELRPAVYELVLAAGGEEEFSDLVKLHETLELNVDKNRALAALGAAPSAPLRARALEYSISDQVKVQDIASVPATMHSASPDGRDAAWDFFKANHATYTAKAGAGLSNLMDGVISSCCANFCAGDKIAEVEAFFQEHGFPKNQRRIKELIESMRANQLYLSSLEYGDSLLAWLRARQRASTPTDD